MEGISDSDLPDVLLHDLDTAWETWLRAKAAKAMGLTVSLANGGLLDQPEALFEDMLTIESIYQRMRDKRGG